MTGNTKLDYILMGLFLLLSMASTGVFVYTESIYKKKLPSNKEETTSLIKEVKDAAIPLPPYVIERLMVNLPTKSKRMRYLEVGLSMTPLNKEALPILEKNKVTITDSIIEAASSMEATELDSLTGKIILEERIKKSIHKKLGPELIKEIFFMRFTIQ